MTYVYGAACVVVCCTSPQINSQLSPHAKSSSIELLHAETLVQAMSISGILIKYKVWHNCSQQPLHCKALVHDNL